jgi:thermostable 8-oxoguanine DNA glycosylase
MIDPDNFTRYDRSIPELEEMILFCVAAAGHNGHSSAAAVDRLLKSLRGMHGNIRSPFKLIRLCSQLKLFMKMDGIGCYNAKKKTFEKLANSYLNLRTCTVDDLERIPGIGPKTSRLFLLHSRPHQSLIPLDRHILRYMREHGYPAPLSTPSSRNQYSRWEIEALDLARKQGMSAAEFDQWVWRQYRVKAKGA